MAYIRTPEIVMAPIKKTIKKLNVTWMESSLYRGQNGRKFRSKAKRHRLLIMIEREYVIDVTDLA